MHPEGSRTARAKARKSVPKTESSYEEGVPVHRDLTSNNHGFTTVLGGGEEYFYGNLAGQKGAVTGKERQSGKKATIGKTPPVLVDEYQRKASGHPLQLDHGKVLSSFKETDHENKLRSFLSLDLCLRRSTRTSTRPSGTWLKSWFCVG